MNKPNAHHGARAAFTLIELLVVVAIIALLLGILAPALSKARQVAMTTKCLANMRNMEVAHQMYAAQYDGAMVNVGLSHGGAVYDEQIAWINTLADFYGSALLHRSPVDDSPHWPKDEGGQGVPVPESTSQLRRTSYGANDFLVDFGNGQNPYGPPPSGWSASAWPGGDGRAFDNVNRVTNPGATVHFLIMAFTGKFAGADHPHSDSWMDPNLHPPTQAAKHVQIDAHGGEAKAWNAVSNWGFLDGHAETLRFDQIVDRADPIFHNRMNPVVAK